MSSEDASIHSSVVEVTRVELHSLATDGSTKLTPGDVAPIKVATPPITGPDHETPTGLGLAYMLPQLQKFSGEDLTRLKTVNWWVEVLRQSWSTS